LAQKMWATSTSPSLSKASLGMTSPGESEAQYGSKRVRAACQSMSTQGSACIVLTGVLPTACMQLQLQPGN
jgi:hypothetical protein